MMWCKKQKQFIFVCFRLPFNLIKDNLSILPRRSYFQFYVTVIEILKFLTNYILLVLLIMYLPRRFNTKTIFLISKFNVIVI